MILRKRLLLIVAILISCVGCDQTTKSVANSYLAQTQVVSLLGGSIRLQVAKNYGAFLSMGAALGAASRGVVPTVVVGVVLVALLAHLFMGRPPTPLVDAAVALIVGGGLSNLIDRVRYGGYVLDFINVGIGPLRTGIFNVADMAIMLGVVLWLFNERLWRRASSVQ